MNNLRFALRQLRKSPGFTVAAVLTLALGIGANTALFSIFKAVVLEPFPYPEADRLVHIWRTSSGSRWRSPLSAPDFLDFRDHNTSFAEMGAYCPYGFNLGGQEPVRVTGVLCSAGVLPALGVAPLLGRWFTEAEEADGSRPVVLSQAAWQERFEGARDIVGRAITINGESHQVVGVMPANFEFLSPWSQGRTFALWTPFPLQGPPGQLARDDRLRDSVWMLVIGRLKPGVSVASAEADLQRIAARIAHDYPKTNGRVTTWVSPFLLATMGSTVGKLLALMATVGFVLLVACANVASLLLARGAGRLTEVAVRVAMGASGRQIVRQMLTESLVLALIGGAVGVVLAQAGLGALRGILPTELPRSHAIQLDAWVLVFTFFVTLATTLLFGLAPAMLAACTKVSEALKEGTVSQASTRTRNRLLRWLAVAQVAVALLITNEAVLLFRSLRNVLATPHAFDTERVLTAALQLSGGRYEDPQQRVVFWEQLIQRVEKLPQVQCAAVANQVPLQGGGYCSFRVEGEPAGSSVARRRAASSFISPSYFQAMGIPLLAGRTLAPGDEQLPLQRVVVNRALAEQCWLGKNPLGRKLHDASVSDQWSAEIIGVVESTHQQRPEQRPEPEIYWLYPVNPWAGSELVVRAAGDPKVLVPAIRAAVKELDANLPLSNILTMGEVLTRATEGRRFITVLLMIFATLILTLAMSGIYGVVSYQVAQRNRELGVRMALGANRRQVFRLVTLQALRLLATGLGLGLCLALCAIFVTRSLLYLPYAVGWLYIGLGAALVFIGGVTAALLPAWRATRVDPIVALRCE